MVVDGHRHVDAGICSTTNADLLASRDDLDLIVVSAPLASNGTFSRSVDAPMRWLANGQIRSEVATLAAAGHRVVTLAPSSAVARSMGFSPLADDRDAQRDVLRRARVEARAKIMAACPDLVGAPTAIVEMVRAA